MLDDIAEIIFELVLEGATQAIDSKSVPKGVRVFLLVVITALLLGVCIFLIGAGINEGEIVLIILGVGLLVGFTALAIYKAKQHGKGRK